MNGNIIICGILCRGIKEVSCKKLIKQVQSLNRERKSLKVVEKRKLRSFSYCWILVYISFQYKNWKIFHCYDFSIIFLHIFMFFIFILKSQQRNLLRGSFHLLLTFVWQFSVIFNGDNFGQFLSLIEGTK